MMMFITLSAFHCHFLVRPSDECNDLLSQKKARVFFSIFTEVVEEEEEVEKKQEEEEMMVLSVF